MDFIDTLKAELRFQRSMQAQFTRLVKIKEEGQLHCKHHKGRKEYYIKEAGVKPEYISRPKMERVYRLQLKKLGDTGLAAAEKNIELLRSMLAEYKPYTLPDLQKQLPEAYKLSHFNEEMWNALNRRNPFPQSQNPEHRHELIHTTSFGLLTRSKGEAQIAEQLMAVGITGFFYEKPLALKEPSGKPVIIHPDFTIPLADGRTIYWEHKGMLDSQSYARRDMERTLLYFRNGIYQPVNLIVTCDGPDGSFPGAEIAAIVERLLVPASESRF